VTWLPVGRLTPAEAAAKREQTAHADEVRRVQVTIEPLGDLIIGAVVQALGKTDPRVDEIDQALDVLFAAMATVVEAHPILADVLDRMKGADEDAEPELREGECQHGADEDHMLCTDCGVCREDLDSEDRCMDCGGVPDDGR
jgi:hypothetical protein